MIGPNAGFRRFPKRLFSRQDADRESLARQRRIGLQLLAAGRKKHSSLCFRQPVRRLLLAGKEGKTTARAQPRPSLFCLFRLRSTALAPQNAIIADARRRCRGADILRYLGRKRMGRIQGRKKVAGPKQVLHFGRIEPPARRGQCFFPEKRLAVIRRDMAQRRNTRISQPERKLSSLRRAAKKQHSVFTVLFHVSVLLSIRRRAFSLSASTPSSKV